MSGRTSRGSFFVKCGAGLLLIAAADALFSDFRFGSWLSIIAWGWCAALIVARPALRHGSARSALCVAALYAMVLFDSPGKLAWMLFWIAISTATLMPRMPPLADAWQWTMRLGIHAITGPFAPLADLIRLLRRRPKHGHCGAHALLKLLAVPVTGTVLFVGLFASANPLIEHAVDSIDLIPPGEVAFWVVMMAIVWPSLRPRAVATRGVAAVPRNARASHDVSDASLLISLAAFNGVFAIENGLDLAFLWSGAPLPAGVTLADYAHRGAYPLIATALLAGIFVLVLLAPGSRSASNPMLRRLVVVWIAQNVLLVASSVLRTCDYIAVYMLTAWRIAALAWMGLVALGLILICWRLLKNRTASWLINANTLAGAMLLSVISVVDLDAMAASWNVHHAREAGGRGVPLDLCQLSAMGAPALVPLIELEKRLAPTVFRDRVRAVRQRILGDDTGGPSLESAQADWRTWSWRDARRLRRARELLGSGPSSSQTPEGWHRSCDGSLVPPRLDDDPATTAR